MRVYVPDYNELRCKAKRCSTQLNVCEKRLQLQQALLIRGNSVHTPGIDLCCTVQLFLSTTQLEL